MPVVIVFIVMEVTFQHFLVLIALTKRHWDFERDRLYTREMMTKIFEFPQVLL